MSVTGTSEGAKAHPRSLTGLRGGHPCEEGTPMVDGADQGENTAGARPSISATVSHGFTDPTGKSEGYCGCWAVPSEIYEHWGDRAFQDAVAKCTARFHRPPTDAQIYLKTYLGHKNPSSAEDRKRNPGRTLACVRDFQDHRHENGRIDSIAFKKLIFSESLKLVNAHDVLEQLYPRVGYEFRCLDVDHPEVERAPAPPVMLGHEDVQRVRDPTRGARGKGIAALTAAAKSLRAHVDNVKHTTVDGAQKAAELAEKLLNCPSSGCALVDLDYYSHQSFKELEELHDLDFGVVKERAAARALNLDAVAHLDNSCGSDNSYCKNLLINALLPYTTLQKRLECLHLLGGSFPFAYGQAPNPWQMGLSQQRIATSRGDSVLGQVWKRLFEVGVFGNQVVSFGDGQKHEIRSRKLAKVHAVAVPVQFHSMDEPLDLLKMCTEVCTESADASIFGTDTVLALESYVTCRFRNRQDMYLCRALWLFRLTNYLWCAAVFTTAWFNSFEHYRGPETLSGDGDPLCEWCTPVVYSDLAALGSLCTFLGVAYSHGLANVEVVVQSMQGWTALLGSERCVPWWVHHGVNCQVATLAFTHYVYITALDVYLAANELHHPIEAPGMHEVRSYVQLGVFARALATFYAVCSVLMGVEALNPKRTRFLIAIARSLAEITRLLLFLLPFLLGSSLIFAHTATHVDRVSHPDIVDLHHRKSQNFLTSADYLFGTDDTSRYLPLGNWLNAGFATIAHTFFMLLFGLVTTNLLIAIVSECWEQSGEDQKMWRHYGRAVFGYMLRKEQARLFMLRTKQGRRGRDRCHRVGKSPLCCGLLPRDGLPGTDTQNGSSGRWSHTDSNPDLAASDVTPFKPAILTLLQVDCDQPANNKVAELADLKETVDELREKMDMIVQTLDKIARPPLRVSSLPRTQATI